MAEYVSYIQKKIIKSLLYGNYDIINISFARIYTSGEDSNFWLYSRLEGALIYCIEVRAKVYKFLLFNLKTFEIVFDFELYKKFNKNFKKESDNFFYFDVDEGFIGLEIPDPNQAEILEAVILNSSLDYIKCRLREYKPMRENELKEKGRKNIEILKKILNSSGNKPIKKEIIINQGELERSINSIEIDEKNGKLIVKGNDYDDFVKKLNKVRGLKIEINKNNNDNKIFSKYISRNILNSYMNGLVVPKRKIIRDGLYEDEDEENIKIRKTFEVKEKIEDNKINKIDNKDNKIYEDDNKINQKNEKNQDDKINKIDNKDNKDNQIKKSNEDIKDNKNNKDRKSLIDNQKITDNKDIKLDTKISLYISSVDQKINETFNCKLNEGFHIIEGLLYEKYPEYKDSENYFLVNGVKINRFKNLKENNIKDGDKIILNILDDDD